MSSSIEEQRVQFESALNSGNLDAALDALEQLKKANCDIRLTMRPEPRSFSDDASFSQRLQYLQNLSISSQQAREIAGQTPSNEVALNIARQRGLV